MRAPKKAKLPRATKTTKATAAQLNAAGAIIRASLTTDELAVLGFSPLAPSPSSPCGDFEFAHELIRSLASSRLEEKRRKAAARVPLVAPRYAKTLAQGILATLVAHAGAKTVPPPWASLAQSAMHASYMAASVPTLSTHDTHPGSRAGVVMVDLRKPEEFSTAAGVLTFASVLARVSGEPRP